MKYVLSSLMTAHLVYYMNQKNPSDGFLNLVIAMIFGIALILKE